VGLFVGARSLVQQQHEARFSNLVGKSKQQILSELGRPKHVLTPQVGKPIEVPWQYDYYKPTPKWPARGEVLVYPDRAWAWVEYIYLNERGVVEHVDTTGS
jgi:hypothetical protein